METWRYDHAQNLGHHGRRTSPQRDGRPRRARGQHRGHRAVEPHNHRSGRHALGWQPTPRRMQETRLGQSPREDHGGHRMTYSELVKQVEENPISKMIGFGGHILLTNDFFFNPGDDSPPAVMLHHGAGF